MELIGIEIVEILKSYGYYVMLPLMFIEGPITTLISSTLASVGVFNILIIYFFSVFADLASDIILYFIGRKYGMTFVRKIGKYIGISENMVKTVSKYLEKHGGKIIILIKATTGLCQVTWVAAGTVKYDFKKFLKYTFLGGMLWSTFLVLMGYFYGYLWKEIAGYIRNAGIMIFILAAVTVIALNQARRYQEKKIFEKG